MEAVPKFTGSLWVYVYIHILYIGASHFASRPFHPKLSQLGPFCSRKFSVGFTMVSMHCCSMKCSDLNEYLISKVSAYNNKKRDLTRTNWLFVVLSPPSSESNHSFLLDSERLAFRTQLAIYWTGVDFTSVNSAIVGNGLLEEPCWRECMCRKGINWQNWDAISRRRWNTMKIR